MPSNDFLTRKQLRRQFQEGSPAYQILEQLCQDSVYVYEDEFDRGLNDNFWRLEGVGRSNFELNPDDQCLEGLTTAADDAYSSLYSIPIWSPRKRCSIMARVDMSVLTTMKFEVGFVAPVIKTSEVSGAVLVKATPTALSGVPSFGVFCYDTDDTSDTVFTGSTSSDPSSTTITDTRASFTVDSLIGLKLTRGASTATITSNTTTVITFSAGWTGGTPASGTYTISGSRINIIQASRGSVAKVPQVGPSLTNPGPFTFLLSMMEGGAINGWLNGQLIAQGQLSPASATATYGTSEEAASVDHGADANYNLWFFIQNRTAGVARDMRLRYVRAWQDRDAVSTNRSL